MKDGATFDAAHIHPDYDEEFHVLEGRVHDDYTGQVLEKDERYIFLRNVPHLPRAEGHVRITIICRLRGYVGIKELKNPKIEFRDNGLYIISWKNGLITKGTVSNGWILCVDDMTPMQMSHVEGDIKEYDLITHL